tara:strand:+ start:1347 stop:1793 length:447 start_codon:yes stop_codon:yes gene_type:complete
MSIFIVDHMYLSSRDYYRVIRRTNKFVYLEQINHEFTVSKTSHERRKNRFEKPIKRKIKTCKDNKVSIFNTLKKGEFITLGFDSKHDNIFASKEWVDTPDNTADDEETYPCGFCDKEMAFHEVSITNKYGWVCDACVEELSGDADDDE